MTTYDISPDIDPELAAAAVRGHAINIVVETTDEIERLRVLEKRQSDRRVDAIATLLDAGWSVKKISEQTGLSYTRCYAAAAKVSSFVKRYPDRGQSTDA